MTEFTNAACRTRKVISDTYLELLEQKPFDKISTKSIHENARMNKSTFYSYYQDKYDLTNQVFYELICEMKQAIRMYINVSAMEMLKQFFCVCKKHKRALKLLFSIKNSEIDLVGNMRKEFTSLYFEILGNESNNNASSNTRKALESDLFSIYLYIPFHLYILEDHFENENDFAKSTYDSYLTIISKFLHIDFTALRIFIDKSRGDANREPVQIKPIGKKL